MHLADRLVLPGGVTARPYVGAADHAVYTGLGFELQTYEAVYTKPINLLR